MEARPSEAMPDAAAATLYRQVGGQAPPGTVLATIKSYNPPLIWWFHWTRFNTKHVYRVDARCPAWDVPGATRPVSDTPFGIRLVQDWNSSILYGGQWTTTPGPSWSGGSTRQATLAGSPVTIEAYAPALAWVTTRDSKPPFIALDNDAVRLACNRLLCDSYATSTPDTTSWRRVMPGGPLMRRWGSESWKTTGLQRLQIIADDAEGVDLHAFIVVENCVKRHR